MASKKSGKLLKIAATQELQEGQSVKFEIDRKDRKTEAFVIKKNGKYYSYLNLCRHWSVGLDFDDNDFFSEDKAWLVCKNHGAIYEPVTGICEGGLAVARRFTACRLSKKMGFFTRMSPK